MVYLVNLAQRLVRLKDMYIVEIIDTVEVEVWEDIVEVMDMDIELVDMEDVVVKDIEEIEVMVVVMEDIELMVVMEDIDLNMLKDYIHGHIHVVVVVVEVMVMKVDMSWDVIDMGMITDMEVTIMKVDKSLDFDVLIIYW